MDNIFYDSTFVTSEERFVKHKQTGRVIWLTGLSGSGKSTLAKNLERFLFNNNKLVCVLDGDNLRHGINSNLTFSEEDRTENIRRTAEIAAIISNLGYIVIVCLISPLAKDRELANNIISNKNIEFKELYISTSIETCESRDVKGLYKKVREGKINNFTGIDSPYESPTNPFLTIDTSQETVNNCIDLIINKLQLL